MTPVPFAEFERQVLKLYDPALRKPNTAKQVRQVLREFGALPVVQTTADLDPTAIAHWIAAHPERSAVTIESLLRALGPLLKFAVFKGWLDRSPLEYRGPSQWVRPDDRPEPKARPGSRTLGEVGRVLELADAEARAGGWERKRLRALVYCYAYLGLRGGEAVHLWRTDVDLAARTVKVQAHREDRWTPKTLQSAAILPIARPLEPVLRYWLRQTGCRWLFPGVQRRGPWTGGAAGQSPLDQVRELGRRAGVPDLTIHSLRKTVGTYAKTWGLGQLELKGLLRHSDVETQAWYDDGPADALRPAVSRVAYPTSQAG